MRSQTHDDIRAAVGADATQPTGAYASVMKRLLSIAQDAANQDIDAVADRLLRDYGAEIQLAAPKDHPSIADHIKALVAKHTELADAAAHELILVGESVTPREALMWSLVGSIILSSPEEELRLWEASSFGEPTAGVGKRYNRVIRHIKQNSGHEMFSAVDSNTTAEYKTIFALEQIEKTIPVSAVKISTHPTHEASLSWCVASLDFDIPLMERTSTENGFTQTPSEAFQAETKHISEIMRDESELFEDLGGQKPVDLERINSLRTERTQEMVALKRQIRAIGLSEASAAALLNTLYFHRPSLRGVAVPWPDIIPFDFNFKKWKTPWPLPPDHPELKRNAEDLLALEAGPREISMDWVVNHLNRRPLGGQTFSQLVASNMSVRDFNESFWSSRFWNVSLVKNHRLGSGPDKTRSACEMVCDFFKCGPMWPVDTQCD